MGKDEMSKMGPSILIALSKKKEAMKDKSEKDEPSEDEMGEQEHLEAIASDLIDAIHDKDIPAVAELLKEAFECLSSSHTEDKY